MNGMPDGVAGETQGDDLVDPAAQPVHSDVRETGRRVSPQLAAESILGSQDKIRLVSGFAEGPDRRPGDDQVSALDEGDVRSDDGDALGHVPFTPRPSIRRGRRPGTISAQGLQGPLVFIGMEDEKRLAGARR